MFQLFAQYGPVLNTDTALDISPTWIYQVLEGQSPKKEDAQMKHAQDSNSVIKFNKASYFFSNCIYLFWFSSLFCLELWSWKHGVSKGRPYHHFQCHNFLQSSFFTATLWYASCMQVLICLRMLQHNSDTCIQDKVWLEALKKSLSLYTRQTETVTITFYLELKMLTMHCQFSEVAFQAPSLFY